MRAAVLREVGQPLSPEEVEIGLQGPLPAVLGHEAAGIVERVERINDAFAAMKRGEVARSVARFEVRAKVRSNEKPHERSPRMRKSVMAGAALAGLAAVSGIDGSRAATPQVATMPTPAVGDTLVYAGNYVTVACSKWQTVATDQKGFIVARCGDDTAYYLASNGALVRITGKDGSDLVSFKPFSPSVQFPLQVGKTWQGNYTGFTADDQSQWDSRQTCKVADMETVQVPAGAMPAFRIDCADAWRAAGAAGDSTTIVWYAPQAHAVVKQVSPGQSKWDEDLASYSLK